jgi:hypothetical protein
MRLSSVGSAIRLPFGKWPPIDGGSVSAGEGDAIEAEYKDKIWSVVSSRPYRYRWEEMQHCYRESVILKIFSRLSYSIRAKGSPPSAIPSCRFLSKGLWLAIDLTFY